MAPDVIVMVVQPGVRNSEARGIVSDMKLAVTGCVKADVAPWPSTGLGLMVLEPVIEGGTPQVHFVLPESYDWISFVLIGRHLGSSPFLRVASRCFESGHLHPDTGLSGCSTS